VQERLFAEDGVSFDGAVLNGSQIQPHACNDILDRIGVIAFASTGLEQQHFLEESGVLGADGDEEIVVTDRHGMGQAATG